MEKITTTRLRALVVAGLLLVALQGCSSLYLHDAKKETATQAAKDDFGKVKVDQYFTEQRIRLTKFADDEDKAVASYMVASRNRQFAGLARTDGLQANPNQPTKTLSNLVVARTMALLGNTSANDTRRVLRVLRDTKVRDLPTKLDLDRENIEVNRGLYRGALKKFEETKPDGDSRPTACAKVPPPSADLPQKTTDDVAYVRLVEACAELQKAKLKSADGKRDTVRSILAPEQGSILGTVFKKSDDADATIDAQTVEADRIQSAIKELQGLAPQSSPKDLADKVAKVQSWLKSAQSAARAAGAKQISQVLENVLAADLSNADVSDEKSKSKTTQDALAVLQLTDALAQANDAFAAKPQIARVNSVLLAIVEQRQKLDMANLEVAKLKDEQQLYSAEEAALIRELALLSVTQRIIDGSLQGKNMLDGFAGAPKADSPVGRAVGAALAAYADSWNEGQIPYQILEFKEVQVERAYLVERAAKTAQNWQGFIAPALDDLVAYGKGGIHPETIATLITNLGLIGAVSTR